MGRHVVAGLDPDYHVTVADRVDGGSHQPNGPVDVLDIEALERAVRGQDAIIHIAALDAAVPAGPHDFFHTNTLAAWNTLHAGYEAGVRKFVVCSSSTVYGVREMVPRYLPIDEAHPTRTTSPYGLSKRVTELVASGFAQRDGVTVIALRPCYVAYSHLIERLASEAEPAEPGAEPVPPLRWYVSPADAARCFRAALEAELAGYHVFNVGAADSFSSKPSLVVAEIGVRDPPRDSPAGALRRRTARIFTGLYPRSRDARLVAARRLGFCRLCTVTTWTANLIARWGRRV